MISGGLPFSAVKGLERASLAIQLSLIESTIGGVLITGTRGTGKTVLVNGAGFIHPDFLPDEAIVNVPIGVTEQNLLGGIDLQRVLTSGTFSCKPGLLEKAHGKILLIDNINLLSDRLADLILDCAASGILTVEREGISVTRNSRFKLFATMDPDEGKLRPQLLDRFDLSVEVKGIDTAEERIDLLKHLLAINDPGEKVISRYSQRDSLLREKIQKARRRLLRVGIKGRTLSAIVFTMSMLEVDGHRPEIVLTKASGALAALRGRSRVIWDDVRDAAYMVLGHRTRKGGLEGPPSEKVVINALQKGWGIGSKYGISDTLLRLWDSKTSILDSIIAAMNSADESENVWSRETKKLKEMEGMFKVQFPEFLESQILKKIMRKVSKTAKTGAGSKHTVVKPSLEMERGKRIRIVKTDDPYRLDVLQTVTAAAIEGQRLPFIPLAKQWWRAWERSSRPRATVMLVIDASKSSRDYLFGLSKLLKTMFEDYFDPMSKVGLISMNMGAPVLHFKPTRNRLRVYGRMEELTSSGYTPLAESISTARRALQKSNTTGDIRGNYILLVSDCAPEPLPLGCQDPYESDLYAEARKQAQKCGSVGIPIFVIDPLEYPTLKSPEEMPGRRLARYIEGVTRGILLHLPAKVFDSDNRVINVINSIASGRERERATENLRREIEKFSDITGPFM
ncbi:MAG: VWA domain-containing protein [Candidatus Aegiribacteria sp.]|nr:VWA domain-containing protein [Candidatus Aegiribacteria sp.]